MSGLPIDELQSLFKGALCLDQLGFQEDGYLSLCATNTYCLALPLLAILIGSIPQLSNMPGGGPNRTRLQHFKVLVCALHCAVVFHFGPQVFNVISLTVSMLTQLVVFVLTYMELNGVRVPSMPLKLVYFVYFGASCYIAIQRLVQHADPRYDTPLRASVPILGASIVAWAFRDIVGSVEAHAIPT